MSTWIKLHRKIVDSLVFHNEKCLKIWLWCLCKAGYTKKTIVVGKQKVLLKKGEFVMGGFTAEETLNIARTTIYYWLDFLKREGMVDIKKTNKYTVITILNWDEYQELDIKWTSNRHQMDTNNKDNKDKKEDLVGKPQKSFIKPTSEEVTEYAKSINYNLNGQTFVDFYDSKGWMIGKNKMKDWKAAIRTWKNKDQKFGNIQTVANKPDILKKLRDAENGR